MPAPPEPYEIRDPIHGFIRLSQLEWDLINQPVVQRLRRIRQLAWTDMVYPGATHTRFEHSLGVMHVATRLFDAVVRRSGDVLRSEYDYDDDMLARQRRIIRLAALLHDVGHGPFSHAAEHLMPLRAEGGRRFEHEDYSAAAIRTRLQDLFASHRQSRQSGIDLADVLDIFSPAPPGPGTLVWKDLVAGQMDADRMDYLLRDAYHAGVQYGRYDLDRVVHTVQLCHDEELGNHQIGIAEDGVHAVEGLLIARYMMFTQLYFHKTRAIYDHHLAECLKALLAASGGAFPSPEAIGDYLAWDDWRVLGEIAAGRGGEHGRILHERRHYRRVFATSEVMTPDDAAIVAALEEALAPLGVVACDAQKSWYKSGPGEIRVWCDSGAIRRSVPLISLSPVVAGLAEVNQRRLYVPPERRDEAKAIMARMAGRGT